MNANRRLDLPRQKNTGQTCLFLTDGGLQGSDAAPMVLPKMKEKGLTIAELLIVVAIIGVLTAISIPILNRILERSRESYDIYTMRQAASAAVDLAYAGITDETSARAAGLRWNVANKDGTNAYGVYHPGAGIFLPINSRETKGMAYGKGTKIDGGTRFKFGNERGAYAPKEDYTGAVVMIAIYPLGEHKHIDIYWKNSDGKYVGGQNKPNDPNYSIRIPLQ